MTRRITLLALLLLSGCGEDFSSSYAEKPAGSPDNESDYHRCMRQQQPLHRFECRQ